MYGTDEYEDYDKLWKSTARAAGSDDEYNEYNSDDRTTVLVTLHHADFRETMLPAQTWSMHPDDTTTGNQLKKWVQWEIWETHEKWIDLTHMWLDLVSFRSSAHYPNAYTYVRQVRHTQQIMELLHDYSATPVIQARRCSSRSRGSNKRQRFSEEPN